MAIQYVDKNCDAVSTNAQTYAITAGTNDKLQIVIDGGSAQNITLTAGGARTAAQVATDINSVLTGATAYGIVAGPQGNHVRIRTTSANGATSTITFNAPANNANTTLGFSGTYTGATRAHNTWAQTLGTKQELINQIETQLDAVGWTTISGSGTTTLLLQSALSPPGSDLQYRLRVKDNGGNCVTLTIENVAGTVTQSSTTSSGIMLLPAAGKNWVFTIHKYGGSIRTSGTMAVREFSFFGSLALPSFLQGVITDCAWITGNANTDTDTVEKLGLQAGGTSTATSVGPFSAAYVNNSLWNQTTTVTGVYAAAIMLAVGATNSIVVSSAAVTPQQWHDGSVILLDALLAFGASGVGDVGKIRGSLWDGCAVTGSVFLVGATTTFDSHNWVVLSDSTKWTTSCGARTQLFLVTP